MTTAAASPSLPPDADECADTQGAPLPAYAHVVDALLGPGGEGPPLVELAGRARAWFADREVTFGAPEGGEGPAPIFPFDPVPRVIGAWEWHRLDRALVQRTMALDAFVADCYGAQRALREGVVPGRLVYTSSGYLRDLVGTRPPRATHCHVAGIDVVRVDGSFCVLEDNVRVPSGVAYALMGRQAMDEIMGDLVSGMGVRPIDGYAARLRRILMRIAPRQWEADLVVLTPGPFNSAYFEHRLLAEAVGGTLCEGHELIVLDDEVHRRSGDGIARVDVIYARVNAEWLDPLVFRPDSVLGVPGLIDAWRRGNVAIANAPGAGIADDKAIYPYVPAMIRYYLGEDPLLDNVPAFDLFDDGQRRHVVAHLDRMVLKPVDASGGHGILFGRLLAAEQREQLARQLEARPRAWLAQEEASLSRAVCVADDGSLEARCVDLRPFVLVDERPWVVPGGLTRVARDGRTKVVNSSQGGGSKDTWVLDR